METQLHYDSNEQQLGLRFREKFITDFGIILKARGLLNTVTGRVSGDAHLWQNVYTLQKQPQGRYQTPSRQQPSPLAVSIGSSYLTGSDEIVSWVRAKQQLRTPGSWRLKLRGKLEFPMKTQQPAARGDIQLSRAVYNFTRAQDVRLLAGYRVDAEKDRQPVFEPYGQLRENNWSLNTDFKGRWNVRYDL